jgi:hypothetical protein
MDTSQQIESWQSQLADLSVQFTETFGHLSPEQLNWKPNAKAWSVGQVIEHIIMVNASYFDIPARIEAGTYKYPFVARFGFYPKMMGNLIYKSVLPETKRKQATLQIWEPAQSNVSEDMLQQFRSHQAELIKFIGENHEMVKKGTLVCSPANKMIVYPLGRAFEIMIAHEQRHFEQAKRVMEGEAGSEA